MSFFGGAPDPGPIPDVKPLPPPPDRSSAQTQELADEQRRKFATAGDGRAGTFLSGSGLSAGSSAVRFLGGSIGT